MTIECRGREYSTLMQLVNRYLTLTVPKLLSK